MQLIDGKKISSQIKEEIKSEVEELRKSKGKVPGLVTILVGENAASAIYVNNKIKACGELGIKSKAERLSADISEEALLELIKQYNDDPEYHGILVQLPLPKHINEDKVIEAISPKKDVDGFHPMSIGNLVIGKDTFVSCTPAGIQELLSRYKIDLKGKHVVVLGRSNIVGKPIANLLLQKKENANAVVTICHSAAKDVSYFTRQADVLIAAIGSPKFVKRDMIKDGVVIIDVGINRIDDPAHPKGSRVVGDVDFDNAAEKASYITPVPGGVGLMTIAMLMMNTLKAFKLYGE